MQDAAFNARQFLADNFGSHTAVVSFLQAFGVKPPTVEATFKWAKRNQVPAEWFPLLVGLLELDRGAPVSITKYIRVGGSA